jgi:hypothetical protein
MKLLNRPFLPRLRIAAHLGRREGVEQRVVGRVHCDQLALQVRGQFRDDDAGILQDALDLVAVCIAFRRLAQIEQRCFACRNLNADKALLLRPLCYGGERVEWRIRPDELRKEDAGSLHGFHG